MEDGDWKREETRRLAEGGLRRIAVQKQSLVAREATAEPLHSPSGGVRHICDGHRPPLQEEHPPPARTIPIKVVWAFCAFLENQSKCLSMNHLRTERGFSNQLQSSLIKAILKPQCLRSISPFTASLRRAFPISRSETMPNRANGVSKIFVRLALIWRGFSTSCLDLAGGVGIPSRP